MAKYSTIINPSTITSIPLVNTATGNYCCFIGAFFLYLSIIFLLTIYMYIHYIK